MSVSRRKKNRRQTPLSLAFSKHKKSMTSPSLFDEKWDIELTLDWLQALVLRRGRRRGDEKKEQQQQHGGEGEGASPPPPPPPSNNVDDDNKSKSNRNQKIRRVVLQFPDALLPVALASQARRSAGSSARALDLEVRNWNREGKSEEKAGARR